MMKHHATVAGGGIAGLAVALALVKRGGAATVLERAEAITEVGAGLQISPNGMRVLDDLGIGAAVRGVGIRAEAVELRDYRRRGVVARIGLAGGDAAGYYFVHRADLIGILVDAARGAGVKVRLLQAVDRITADDRPTVTMHNGNVFHPDILIGADGVRSRVRPAINGSEAPFFTRQVAWRAIVPNHRGQGPAARVYMGPRRHLVTYPLRGGAFLNVVAVQERTEWASEGWSHTDDPENLRAAFRDFGPEARAILGAVDQVHLWGLFRHPVAKKWAQGRCVLLGDAAHPTLPFLAQGANMALEDAWTLAAALARHSAPADAFAAYQEAREARVRRVIETANGNAWKYHLAFPPMRWGAHLGMAAISRTVPQKLVQAFDWLYDYDVTRDAFAD